MSTSSDLQRVVSEWQKRRDEIEQGDLPASVASIVERSAVEFGRRIAWDFFEHDERWTFLEVRDGMYRAARALRASGVARGDTVAMMVPNGGLYLSTWLALGYIGAAVVPLNGRYTPAEVDYVIQVTQPKLVVVDASHERVITSIQGQPHAPHLLLADGAGSWSELIAAQPSTPLEDAVGTSEDLMNVQFTSGTTGFPKGCMLPQRYWINAAVVWSRYVNVPVHRILVNQMLFYLDGQFNAMVAIYRGATLYCCDKPSAANFMEWLRRYEINEVFYFDPLYKAARTSDDTDNALSIIHIFGFQPRLHADLQRRYGAPARESFGMTEFAPALLMPLDAEMMVGSGSCGLPAPFTELRIIDDDGTDVPEGATGELILRSPAQMLGYYNNPDATAEAIRAGWLHTGDLFRKDEAGFYYIVGRKKDMIRRNAENIACVEVESVLRLAPEVKEAAVVPVPDEWVGEEVKAYVELQDGVDPESFDPRALLDMASKHLASFKIPRYLAIHSGFPMTESARVEKKKIVAGVEDLRAGSYDRVNDSWIPG